ncbi:MAG: hypothetical protein ACREVK_01185 [Gammaproteobacteria bacterium]
MEGTVSLVEQFQCLRFIRAAQNFGNLLQHPLLFHHPRRDVLKAFL